MQYKSHKTQTTDYILTKFTIFFSLKCLSNGKHGIVFVDT